MAQPSKHIFILASGSNMAGRGGVDRLNHWDGVVPPQCVPDPAKIYRLNADLQWEVASEPLHKGIDNKNTCGVGPGMAFANSVKKYMGENYVIGLIPCAASETAIKEWGRGTPLFENLVKRAKAGAATSIPIPTTTSTPSSGDTATSKTTTTTNASCTTIFSLFSTVTSTTTASPTATATQAVTSTATSTSTNPATANGIPSGNEIKALLWYQGESDAKSDDDANSYKRKMEEVIANIREDLKSPGLPVIEVAITSSDGRSANIEKIRKAQLEMKVENTECVDAKGLTLKEGNLTTQAQVKLGEMLAIKYCDCFAG